MEAQREKIRTELMDGVIKVVVNNGFDKATTRAITSSVSDIKLNDAYIYRYFQDKEDLFQKAFMRADKKFIQTINDNLHYIEETDVEVKERCRKLWYACWEFLLGDKDEYIFYLRYYYSAYFKEYALKEHMALYEAFMERFEKYVPQAKDVAGMMHTILEFALSELAKVDDPHLRLNEREKRNFELVWNIILLYSA